jgi:hypothetical protein
MRAVRGILITVAILALLAGGLYYADGRLDRRAEQRVATDLQQQLGTPEPPTVDIEGRPFLTQVASRSISTVRVVADQIGAVNEAPLVIAHADLVLSDVTSDDWFATMLVSHAAGTVRMDYSVLQSLAGVPLTYVGDGRVQIVETATVFGQPVEAKITGAPTLNVREQTISLNDPAISVADITLPEFTAKALLRALLKPIPVSGVPFGLMLTSISAMDDGLHAEISGDNLAISR